MNIRNTKRRMSGTNTYKENLLNNKQKQNVNNINIAFEPLETFKPCGTFMDSRHPRHYFLPIFFSSLLLLAVSLLIDDKI